MMLPDAEANVDRTEPSEVTPMDADPRVSVVIAVYNGETSILRAVRSALNQTHRNLEVIVVDDGSTDGTWNLLRTIDDPRLHTFQQANGGASSARNLGITHATGTYVAFLDADDLWLPHKLASELDTFRRHGNRVGIVYSWYYCVDENGVLFKRSPPVTHAGDVFEPMLNAKLFIIPSASLFHKGVFESVGTYDTTRRYHEDYAYMLRASRLFPAFPTMQYSAIYTQSLGGKARRVMRDYDAAVAASMSIADDSRAMLSAEQEATLRENLRTELYFRFLMYGFNASAARLASDIPPTTVTRGAKGLLGWIFAKTGINLMMPGRKAVQTAIALFGQRRWRRFLKKSGVAI